jgi:hypothetical protein
MDYYKSIDKCRVCNSEDIKKVLKLKEQYIGSTFVKDNTSSEMSKVKIPLTLMFCKNCSLIQLKETVDPELLYKNYFYRTGVNETMKRDLRNVVESAMQKVSLQDGDYVVDIGANDATMLSMFPDNLNRVGIEPAKNIDWSHLDKSITIVNDYLSKEAILKGTKGNKAKIITSCAMFYDLNDPNKAVQELKECLHEDGILVIQVSYLLSTIKDFNYQDICHEHLEYYSLYSLHYLMERNDLTIFDASLNFVNGGSLRIYVTHSENKKSKTDECLDIFLDEGEYGLQTTKIYKEFNKKIKQSSKKIKNFVLNEIKNGGSVIGLAASTKGNVILQVCGLNKKIIPYISDRNKQKVGLHTLGTDMILISEEEARKMNPSMMLVLTHHFKDEIVKREKEYIDNGGKLLFVMPNIYVLDKDGEHEIND